MKSKQSHLDKDNSSQLSNGKADQTSQEFRVVDKRHFLNTESGTVESTVEEKPRFPTYVEELLSRVAETEQRFEQKKRQIDEEIRRTRERLESDYQRKLDLEKQKMLLPFLEVLDNLERALEAALAGGNNEGLMQGIELTVALFRSKLEAQGVEPIDSLNQPFDPNLGQAVGVIPVSDEKLDGVIIEEVLRGYLMGNQLLRAAQVRVGEYQGQSS